MKIRQFLIVIICCMVLAGLTGCADPIPMNSTSMLITFVTPNGSVTISSNTYLVSGTAMDANGVYKIYISVNGSEYKLAKGNTNWQTNLTGLTVGTYSLRVYGVSGQFGYSSTNTAEFTVKEADWVNVGNAGFTTYPSDSATGKILFDKNNTPYIMYNSANLDGAVIMKYTGSSWSSVGSVQSDVYLLDCDIDSSGSVYGVGLNTDNSFSMMAKKYNGSAWGQMGTTKYVSASVARHKIQVIPSGSPIAFYVDSPIDYHISADKFDGSDWVSVGGFSSTGGYFASTVSASGTVFLSYDDRTQSGKITVVKYANNSWDLVGKYGFSTGGITYHSIAVDAVGTPYVAYCNDSGKKGAIVKKYNGSNWVSVGADDFTPGQAERVCIVVDAKGTPYVAFVDVANGGKASVMKYNGSAWVNVGAPGITPQSVTTISLKLDSTGRPYVFYSDIALSGKGSVLKYNGSVNAGNPTYLFFNYPLKNITIDTNAYRVEGFADDVDGVAEVYFQMNGGGFKPVNGTTNWYTNLYYIPGGTNVLKIYAKDSLGNYSATNTVKLILKRWHLVGTAGFTSGTAGLVQIAVDKNSTPYVLYTDGANGNRLTAMKYAGSSWSIVGSAGFSAGLAGSADIAIDSTGTPYVAFRDFANGTNVTVMKYNGVSWENVGTPGFGAGRESTVSLAINSTGTPYVAYTDVDNEKKATVRKFNGTTWETVGSAGFTTNTVYFTAIGINSVGTPYIIYQNKECGNRAEVSKFNGSIWEVVGDGPISIGAGNSTGIAFDTSDTLYVVYSELTNFSLSPRVKKYTGSVWTNVGPMVFGNGQSTSIAVGTNNVPYVFFEDLSSGQRLGIGAMFKNSDWWWMGTEYTSTGWVIYPEMTIDPVTCEPYVVYIDQTNGNRATVKVYK